MYYYKNRNILFFCLFILVIVLSYGFVLGVYGSNNSVNQINEPARDVRAGDSGLTNQEYAERLKQDGWPAEKLNTAAGANYLSDTEKNVVLVHNLIRHDPVKYADLYVAEHKKFYSGKELRHPGVEYIILTHEGVLPAEELYSELQSTEPLPLFYVSEKLSAAASSHAEYQSRTGETGHGGQGGLQARIEREGEWKYTIGENITYGRWSGHSAVLGLMVDDGVPGRGHRINILNEDFRVLGVASESHPVYQGDVYVIKYAGDFEDVEID